ncbi:MAG: Hsp20/alpha crystallin family protein [Thaumarchaeota archaeon]|nr:Hsp20/alpha crystallin family protein [Nitrososphaerota archaeon]
MGPAERLAQDMTKEIGAKTREFYEFVLPPIDMYVRDDSLIVAADMPGFEKKDVSVTLRGRMLRIQACKEREAWLDIRGGEGGHGGGDGEIICAQRPSFVDKKMRLPAAAAFRPRRGGGDDDDGAPAEGEEKEDKRQSPTAKYEKGVLTIVIPVRKRKGLEIAVK